MHMADALISPQVGGIMWLTTAGTIAYCSGKIKKELNDSKIPLMGVLGAFVFAAQMINFTIPGTGSSGHLGGGLLLAIMLGSHAAFITTASVLFVQALFFADGGLMALGCNIFNLGFFPCFIAYPLVYQKIIQPGFSKKRLVYACITAAVLGLQLGAFSVVLQTTLSGITSLPFTSFALMVQPIHLAIGVVEGLVTAGVVIFIWKARPELIEQNEQSRDKGFVSLKYITIALVVATMITGGVLSWFASGRPDGLEWSIFNVSGKNKPDSPENGIHEMMDELQKKISVLPDYDFKNPKETHPKVESEKSPSYVTKPGATVSGIIGGLLTFVLAAFIGYAIKKWTNRTEPLTPDK